MIEIPNGSQDENSPPKEVVNKEDGTALVVTLIKKLPQMNLPVNPANMDFGHGSLSYGTSLSRSDSDEINAAWKKIKSADSFDAEPWSARLMLMVWAAGQKWGGQYSGIGGFVDNNIDAFSKVLQSPSVQEGFGENGKEKEYAQKYREQVLSFIEEKGFDAQVKHFPVEATGAFLKGYLQDTLAVPLVAGYASAMVHNNKEFHEIAAPALPNTVDLLGRYLKNRTDSGHALDAIENLLGSLTDESKDEYQNQIGEALISFQDMVPGLSDERGAYGQQSTLKHAEDVLARYSALIPSGAREARLARNNEAVRLLREGPLDTLEQIREVGSKTVSLWIEKGMKAFQIEPGTVRDFLRLQKDFLDRYYQALALTDYPRNITNELPSTYYDLVTYNTQAVLDDISEHLPRIMQWPGQVKDVKKFREAGLKEGRLDQVMDTAIPIYAHSIAIQTDRNVENGYNEARVEDGICDLWQVIKVGGDQDTNLFADFLEGASNSARKEQEDNLRATEDPGKIQYFEKYPEDKHDRDMERKNALRLQSTVVGLVSRSDDLLVQKMKAAQILEIAKQARSKGFYADSKAHRILSLVRQDMLEDLDGSGMSVGDVLRDQGIPDEVLKNAILVSSLEDKR